jgi:DNA invertase Pin-like site-specific DNA recombinase
MKTKAFSYLRVSGKGQIDGDGFPRQREAVTSYAKRHQIEIVQEFCEKGVSGTKDAFDREALTDLFVALKANGVRVVLVERADRLARDLMISEILLGEFRKLGVKVISAECCTELTVEDDDPTKKLIRQVLGAISEWEKSVIVQKLRAARMRIRRSEGRCEGRKPYGADDNEKHVIGLMRQWQSEGRALRGIADRLNAEGIKTRTAMRAGKDTKWHAQSVQRILAKS